MSMHHDRGVEARSKARGHLGRLSSKTTFLDALVVPELAAACARSLDYHMDGPGAGLRKLRLLSQGVRAAVQPDVQGYTLKLGDAPGIYKASPDNLDLSTFLNRCGLIRLRIMIPTLDTENTSAGKRLPGSWANLTRSYRPAE